MTVADRVILCLGQGLGSGLSPLAPGTAGTALAALLYLPLREVPAPLFAAIVVVLIIGGTWICGRSAHILGAHDHRSIVIDEVAGYFVAIAFVPYSIGTWIAAFVLFRVFDVVKPWPVSWLDRHLGGGLGIMLDDVAAGVLANVTLRIGMVLLPVSNGQL